eukprot:4274641-Amphidinium_carterae.1
MQQKVVGLLQAMASRLEPAENGLVFLVNNCDLVLTIFHERHLPRSATSSFEELLRIQVALFVENQLMRYYPDLVNFVKVTEPLVEKIDESAARANPTQGPPPGVEVPKMEEI